MARRPTWHALTLWSALAVPLGQVTPGTLADVTGAQVKEAIRRGVSAVKARQNPDGTWDAAYFEGGETCLAALALLHAGEPRDAPALASALSFIRDLPNQHVYVVALKIMALAQADPRAYRRQIAEGARWLADAQGVQGLWSYTPGEKRFDHSNSQFALLGLHAAAQAGVRIPPRVWKDALAGLTNTQKNDGGWTYQVRGPSYGSMTAAGVADLLILGTRLQVGRERGFHDGVAPKCGSYRTNRPLAGGLAWLGRHFQPDRNPRRGDQHRFYWLYAVERCGILSGQRYFGRHDWYREGAAFLVRSQRADGTWNNSLVDTCFALLFLAKGHRPLLIQKLQWSADEAWTPDRYDVEHLVAFIDDKLGQPVAWQVVSLDAPLEEWLAAPLLYLQGHEFPALTAEQRAKLRRYVEQGGTLLAEACCGKEAFRTGFRRFSAETFPEFPLRELGADHGIYHTFYDCEPYGLMGIDLGCRTSVIFLPNDLSCLWEQADLPRLSERAFKLGTNLAAYALGRRPLSDRLDVIVLPEEQAPEPGPPPRDALQLAQVVYEGDWRPFPHALVRLAEFLRSAADLDVVTQYRTVRLTDPDLFACPILYLAGRFGCRLSDEEQQALVRHLKRGGFLLVDNCCGPEPFDTYFRDLVTKLFPQARLEPLPADHPILRGRPGFDVSSVQYGPDVRRELPELRTPVLWGLTLEGRLALVYSPYALGCGLEGKAFSGCWGLAAEDARRVAANIILYALTH